MKKENSLIQSLRYASAAALRADVQEANLGLGRTALACCDEYEAEMGLLRALQRDPASADGQYMLALAFERQGRLDMAMALLTRIDFGAFSKSAAQSSLVSGQTVVLNAANGWSAEQKQRAVRASAGRVAARLGRFEEALKLLDSLSRPLVWHEEALMAFALLKLGRSDEAISLYRAAAQRAEGKDRHVALKQLCQSLAALKRFEEAFAVARELRSTRPHVLAALGVRAGRADIVREATDKEETGWLADAGARRSYRARAKEMEGDEAGTLAELQRAVREDPSREVSQKKKNLCFLVSILLVTSAHGRIWRSMRRCISLWVCIAPRESLGAPGWHTGFLEQENMPAPRQNNSLMKFAIFVR